MVEMVQCPTHGEQECTFVCQHLVEALRTGVNVGFYWSSEPRGDAWCNVCEVARLKHGGISGDWNEKSEEVAGIQILCGRCYDRVRAQQVA